MMRLHTGYMVCCLVALASMVSQASSEQDCFKTPTDVVFALDSSTSIWGPDFKRMLKFVRRIVKEMDVSIATAQVGVVTFGDDAQTVIGLNDHRHQSGVTHAINKIEQSHGSTRTDLALDKCKRMLDLSPRPHSRKMVILITDGASSENYFTLQVARDIHADNIPIYVIGVGDDVDQHELKGIASVGERLFNVDNFEKLHTVHEILIKALCPDTISTTPSLSNDVPSVSPEAFKPKPVLGCGGKPADVVFILDSSSSIWQEDFARMLDFVSDVTAAFQINSTRTRVGAITFGSYPKVNFNLNHYYDKTNLINAIRGIEQITGGTNTARALHIMRRHSFHPARGARDHVPHIGIVITDGASDDPVATSREASKAHQAGIHMFAIGVGKRVIERELRQIASDPDDRYMFTVNDFSALKTLRTILAVKACENLITTTLPTTVTTTPTFVPTTVKTTPTTQTTPTTPTTVPTTTPRQSVRNIKRRPFIHESNEMAGAQLNKPLYEIKERGHIMPGDQGCGLRRPADVVFAMPGSASPDNTNMALRFIRSLTKNLDIASDRVRVGMVPKDCHELPGFRLDDFDDPSDIDKRLSALEYRRPNIAMTLHYMRTMSFKPCHGSRPEAKRIGVVIVDDDSENLKETLMEARKAKLDKNIELFVVSVGDRVSEKEVEAIASPRTDEHVMNIRSYAELQGLVRDLAVKVNYSCLGLI